MSEQIVTELPERGYEVKVRVGKIKRTLILHARHVGEAWDKARDWYEILSVTETEVDNQPESYKAENKHR